MHAILPINIKDINIHPKENKAYHLAGTDHAVVELIRITLTGFDSETLEFALFGVIVARSLHIVFVLFEETEFGAVGGLGALAMLSCVEGFLEGSLS